MLESKMTTVLHAMCKDGKYIFQTKIINSTCKHHMGGAFQVDEIEKILYKY